MELEHILSYQWSAMLPEFIILGVATLICLIDLCMPSHYSRRSLGYIAIAGTVISLLALLPYMSADVISILDDTFRLDSFSVAFKLILLAGSTMVLLLAVGYTPKEGLKGARGEFYYLFLIALLGSMMMASSGDLVTLFIGLETLAISSYILVGIRRQNSLGSEAAIKYVITGGISTAITLFGMSYLYGLTGTTNLKAMGSILSQVADGQLQYIYGIAFFMMFVGLSFKIAAAPFHMWAPDVYQGAPTPVTAFLGIISKCAGFILLVRVIITLFLNAPGDMEGLIGFMDHYKVYIGFLAGLTILVGNLIALKQHNLKRLMAYSSIAHAGYVLIAIASLGYFTTSTIWFYLVAYLFMSLGAFAVIQYVGDQTGSEELSSFSGLFKKVPILAVLFALFVFSMAGIPGTAGFIAKLSILLGAFAVEPGHYVLAVLLLLGTVISYVYYFGILKHLFFRPAADGVRMAKVSVPVAIVLGISAAGTLLLGIFPGAAMDFLFSHFGDFENFLK
ncbi:NADH-quinone oxidoreductase subunit NuoN [Bacillus sp. 1P06AnD]|uniref:NADH-quinone oxidoreductase subunit NuoN n=1 Tax=Bacillus sp. 1P06AnD TaxID=3132208 RepID=UPI0039A3606C